MADPALWGIHAGQTGEADALFLKSSVVAIGWPRVGNIAKLPANRDGFKTAVANAYPEIKAAGIPNSAGQLFRFVHEMTIGDLIVYPSKRDRQVHLGTVVGEYKFDATSGGVDLSRDQGYPNMRPVTWSKAVPRTSFSQGALYEIGSALSLFQVRNYADEFRSAMEGHTPPITAPDDSTGYSADDLVQATRDFVLKRLAQDLKGHPLASFVAHLLEALGYYTRVAPEGPDGGVDIVAHKDELGFEPPIVKVQVKSSAGSVGQPEVSALMGTVAQDEMGLIVTLGSFSPQARTFAKSKHNLRLLDGQELVDLVLTHYDELSAAYKGIVPLRQIRVPIPPSEIGE